MKFTCVIGSYNPNREWLGRAIASACGLFDEIILTDDGSKIPIDWDYRFYGDIKKYRHKDNMGLWGARNTAIKNATGDIICPLDDDDYFNRDGVVRLKKFINENPEGDIWHFLLQEFGELSDTIGYRANPKKIPEYNSINGVSWFRRAVWRELGGYKRMRAEDWNFWVRCFEAKKKFIYFPEAVYNYNVRKDSHSRTWGVSAEEIRKEVFDNL